MPLEQSLSPGNLIGPYQLVGRLPARRELEVWRAYHGLVNRFVAIELFPYQHSARPGFLARFARDARLLSRLHHPNILPVNQFGEHGARAYLVRPLVTGLTLDYLFGDAWPLAEALLVLDPLAAALEYAHARGIAHRDLRSSDVLITDDARVMLLGFPIEHSDEASECKDDTTDLLTGVVADIRALGRIGFELVNGRPMFEREVWPVELQPRPAGPLSPPCTVRTDLPPSAIAALHRALLAEPTDRFPTIIAMVQALATSERPPAQKVADPPSEAVPSPALSPPPTPLPTPVEGWPGILRRLRLPREWKRLAASVTSAAVAAGLAYLIFVQPALALLAGRGEHAAVALLDGEILAIGGCSNVPPASSPAALLRSLRMLGGRGVDPGRLDTTPYYSPADGRWAGTAHLLQARCGARAVALAVGRALVVGGQAADDQPLPTAERYDRSTDAWTSAGRLYLARRDFAAVALVGGPALALGGAGPAGDNEPLASAERYDPTANRWALAASLVEPRRLHAASLLPDGRVLASGGIGRAGVTLASAERWDALVNAWTPAAALRQARAGHTATLLSDGRVLVVGGLAGHTRLATAERYDPVADAWTRAANLAQPRSGHTATRLADGQVLVVGGLGPTGELTSAERYDPIADTWTPAGNLPRPRVGHTTSRLPNGRVLVVGGRSGDSSAPYLQTTDIYDPTTNRWTSGPDLPF